MESSLRSSFIAFIFILTISIYALNYSNYITNLNKGVDKVIEKNSVYHSNSDLISIMPFLINKSETGSYEEINHELTRLKSNTLEIELIELSSKINPNFVDFTIFKEPYLKHFLKDQYNWRDLYQFREEKGLLNDISPYYRFFKDDMDILTNYNLPNINNMSDDIAQKLYSLYSNDDARSHSFKERVVQNRINGTILDERTYRTFLTGFNPSIANIITTTPAWNVNYIDQNILRALITKKYRDRNIDGFVNKRETLLRLRETKYIKKDEIESLLQLKPHEQSILTYLGDRTTFYLIRITNKKENSITELIFKWSGERYVLLGLNSSIEK